MSAEVQERLERLQVSINDKYDTIEELEAHVAKQNELLISLALEPPSEISYTEAELELATLKRDCGKLLYVAAVILIYCRVH
jgi:hypothetical protein